MTALTADRNTPSRSGDLLVLPVRSATTIYAGSLVCADGYTGQAVPGGATPADAAYPLIAMGRAEATVVNPSGGALTVPVRRGVFAFDAAGLTAANIGQLAYVVDDQTVGVYAFGRVPAGQIMGVDAAGVWVAVGEVPPLPLQGRQKTYVPIHVATLVGTGVYRAVAPVAGVVTRIWSVLEGALTTGNATLTARIGTNAITDGALTLTQSGSAAGDVDSATPTAENAVEAGDVLSVTVGGTNATASVARVLVEITH